MAPLGHSYSLVYSPSSLFPILSPKWPTPFPLIPSPHRAPISTKSAIPLLHPFPGPPQHSSPPSQLQENKDFVKRGMQPKDLTPTYNKYSYLVDEFFNIK